MNKVGRGEQHRNGQDDLNSIGMTRLTYFGVLEISKNGMVELARGI